MLHALAACATAVDVKAFGQREGNVKLLSTAQEMDSKQAAMAAIMHEAILKAEKDSAAVIEISSLPSDREVYESTLDKFLERHRWWLVESEPYEWQAAADRKPLVMKRIPCAHCVRWLKWITKIQYVEAAECAKRPVGVFFSDSAWGAFQSSWIYSFSEVVAGGAIFMDYQKRPLQGETKTLGWKFVPKAFCPSQQNKWLCYYLPQTSCASPASLDDCANQDCVNKALPHSSTANFYFPATRNGTSLTDNEFRNQKSKWIDKSKKSRLGNYRNPWQRQPRGDFGRNPLTDVKGKTRQHYAERFDIGMSVWYGMQFNSRMRSLLAQTIDAFMTSSAKGWDWTEPSVAIQIRRGDRVRGVTMEQLATMCAKWEKNRGTVCNNGSCQDLGCGYPRETWWPGLTLQRYLQRAEEQFEKLDEKRGKKLGDAQKRNVFIMTDDGNWVEQQMKITPLAKKYNIYQISGDPLGQGAFGHDDKKLSETLAFWASVMLCQKCNAFVGSWGSAVTKLVYRFMCMHHADTYGVCPSASTMTVRL